MTLAFSQRGFAARACAGALALAITAVAPAFAAPSTAPTTPTSPAARPSVTATDAGPIPQSNDAQSAAFRAALAAKQAKVDELEAQLDALDRDLAVASEAYNKAEFDLQSTKDHLISVKVDLANAQTAYDSQLQSLSDRARSLYVDGDLNVLNVLLGSKSLGDFIGRVKFLRSLGESDASIAAALQGQRDQISRNVSSLKKDELRARSLQFELQARKIEVMLRIQEREAVLSSTQSDLLTLLDNRAAARQKAEAALLREVLSGANKAGIVVQPGSPVETALAYFGVPYLWGGATPRGFDCSGLVMYVMQQHGVSLPHYSGAQFQLGERIAPADLQPGDVVFFGSPVYHVGMYMGSGYFIQAPRTGDFVKLSRLADRTDYAGARRYPWAKRTAPIVNAVVDPVVPAQ